MKEISVPGIKISNFEASQARAGATDVTDTCKGGCKSCTTWLNNIFITQVFADVYVVYAIVGDGGGDDGDDALDVSAITPIGMTV